jgi:hypothetical protein
MAITSSLQDALANSTSADNPGSQNAAVPAADNSGDSSGSQGSAPSGDSGRGLEALAQPDVEGMPPNSTTPSDGALRQSMSPQNNPAQTEPLPTGPPPGLEGLGGRLRGVLCGLAMHGAPGAVAGAIDPNAAKTDYVQNQEMRQAQVAGRN